MGVAPKTIFDAKYVTSFRKAKGLKGTATTSSPPEAVLRFIRTAYDFVDPTAEMSANPPLN